MSVQRSPRSTSRAIVVHNDHILLIERWRDDLHYFSIPGGGIEADETPEQTILREIDEETTLSVSPLRKLYELQDGQIIHHFYLCEYQSGQPHLPDSSEEAQAGPHNRFKPLWVPLSDVEKLTFMYWKPIQHLLIQDIQTGFSKNVKVTTVS